ncbi:MAG: DUF1559 domain-containing protein [Gemmataceae bacterium]
MRRATLALVPLVWACPARADEGKDLAPSLDDRTFAALRLDLRKIDLPKVARTIAPKASPAKGLSDFVEGLVKDGAGVVYVVASLADLPDEHPFLLVPPREGADLAGLTRRLEELKKLEPTLGVSRAGGALIVGGPKAARRLQSLKATPRPDLRKALTGSDGLARLVVVPTTDARRVLDETLPTLPDELGGGSITPLSRGLRSLSLDLEVAPRLVLRLAAQTDDGDAAVALESLVGSVLKRLQERKALPPDLARLAALWKPKRDGSRLGLTLDEKVVADLLRPYVERFVMTEQQSRAAAQVRQLLKAMHDYEAKYGTFPPHCSRDKKENRLLSWRVHLLPFLGEDKLYREFKLAEPWDGNHNKTLLARMPVVYRPADEKLAARHRTTFLVPWGKETLFPPRSGVRVAEINDGTENTTAVVDVADDLAVEWTRPDDLEVTEKDPRKGLSTRYGGQFLLGLADGTVRFLPATTPPFTLWGLFTRAGGEVLELP